MSDIINDLRSKARDVLDSTDIDEKLVHAAHDVAWKAKDVLDKTDIDEKLIGAAHDVAGKAKDAVQKAKDAVTGAPCVDETGVTEAVAEQLEAIRAAASSNPIHDYFHPSDKK